MLETTHKPVQTSKDDERKAELFDPLRPFSKSVRSFALQALDEDLAEAMAGNWDHKTLEGGGHEFTLTLPNGLAGFCTSGCR